MAWSVEHQQLMAVLTPLGMIVFFAIAIIIGLMVHLKKERSEKRRQSPGGGTEEERHCG